MSADRIDRAAGLELGDDGEQIGRDPRQMTQDELRALGHEPMSPLAALRARCLDCCAGSAAEVRRCTAIECPAWPFRTGENPWRAPKSAAQLAAARESGKKLARARRLPGSDAEATAPV